MGEFAQLEIDPALLERLRETQTERFLTAARQAVEAVGRLLELELERATSSAGLGRLAKAWQSRVYPASGLADVPTAWIFPKGNLRTKGAIRQFGGEGPSRIRSSGGFLAIPLPGSGARRTETPTEYQFRTGTNLRLVPRRGRRPALLVLDNARESGKRRIAKRNRAANPRRVATIPIFVLLPAVDVRARFSIKAIESRYPEQLARSFKARLPAR